MATTPDQTILLSYYIKRKYYHHAITLCDKLIQQKGQSDTIGFWKAVASSFEGDYDEAISELDNLRGSAEFELAVIDALVYTHKQRPRVDDAAVDDLEDSRRGVEKKCTMTAKQRAAEYNILIGEYRSANKLCTKILGENPDHTEAKIIQFTVECLIAEEKNKEREKTGKERRSKDDDGEGKEEKGKDKKLLGILQEMQSLMSRNSAPRVLIDGNMAISRYYLSKKKFNESLEALNKILVSCPWYFPASLEKVRVFSTQTKWDQCEEILSSILVNDANQIEAVMYKLFVDSIIDSNIDLVAGLRDLLLLYNKLEPKNAELYYKTSQLFSRLSGKDSAMINITIEMCKKSCDLQPIGHPEYLVELGYEYSQINDYKSAVAAYTKANEQDDSNSDGLTGILYCQIQQGKTSEATQQFEFLKVIQDEGDETAQFLYLNALLDFCNDRNLVKFMVRLQKAYETHKSQIRRKIYLLINTPEWFIVYNPLFPLNIVEAIINQIPFEPIDETQSEPPELKTAKSIVSDLLGYCPNTITILYYSARLQYLYRDFNTSLSIIARILQKDPGNSLAYLLRAKIALSKEDYREAQSALDEAVSHNFDVRNYPIYFIIKGEVLDNKGEYNEALKLLKTSMTLPGMKKNNNNDDDKKKISKEMIPTSNEKAQLYLLLARVYSDLNQVKEGKATIQEALVEFKGTPNEVNIMVASAELSLKRGDAKTAFKLLNHIQEDNKYFVKIQIVKADIYLKYVNNKRKYIDCYKKIVEKFNTPEMNMMVGDALMKIQRPDEAILEYENALSHKNNPALAYKIGKAYMSIHQYQQAIEKFSKALKNDSNNIEYRYSLADLYFKLDKYDLSIGLIIQGLNETENKTDITSLMHSIKLLRLYADISKTQGDSDKYLELLEKTHNKQTSLLDALKGEQPEKVQEQRIIAADLCYDIALHYISTGSSTNAIKYLTNALKHDAGHINSMLELTKIYIKQEDTDRAEEQCGKLLTVAPQNEEAAMILADILFEKNDFAKAIGYFETSLSKKADNFVALYRLIKLMYRNGQIKDVEQYIKSAERTSEVSRNSPGYFFCKGLFLRYTNEPHDAIEYLNKARKNEYWGPLATELMVQIFLNPENEKLWATDTCEPDAIKSLQAAEYLLSDPCFDKLPEKKSIYHAYTLMYTKEKSKILEGLEEVNKIMTTNKECIPAYLAISIGYMLDKQTTKARNFLKTMTRFPYNQLEAEVFEDSWLLLSDIYIQSGKYDLAQENCKKALMHNKSCARAWEQMGYIMEKECSYKDAADHYEKAWELLYHSDASIGYKLGFNYLKAKRFVEAIDVCSDVLKKFPDYPKIREDILRKAQENLRS